MMNVAMLGEGACGPAMITKVSGCYACGGRFSVQTGDFQRCTSCRAENYCPHKATSIEERVQRWFFRRGIV